MGIGLRGSRAVGMALLVTAVWVTGAWAGAPAVTALAQRAPADHDAQSRAYFTDLELLTQDGERVRFYSDVLRDQVVLINFIFTHCEGACPMLTHRLTQVRDLMGSEEAQRVRFVSISIDPERDTPEALKAFSQEQRADDENWWFLTGEPDHVHQVVKRLGQYSPDVEAHSTLLLAGNVRNRHWMKIPPNTPAPAIATKLGVLVAEE